MNIAKIRISRTMSQKQVAKLLNVSRSTVAMWETGKAAPTADKLPRIAEALKCSIEELFSGDTEGQQTHESGRRKNMRNWLKKLRENQGLTQRVVAEALGVTRQYYNLIESGERQSKMSIETAQKLAVVFNVPIAYILKKETKIS